MSATTAVTGYGVAAGILNRKYTGDFESKKRFFG